MEERFKKHGIHGSSSSNQMSQIVVAICQIHNVSTDVFTLLTDEMDLKCVHFKVAIPLLCLERQLLLGDNENNSNEDGDLSNLQKRYVNAIVHCSKCKKKP